MSKRRDPLPRLNIAPNLNMQQPMGGPGQALYSPALPTSLQQSFHPSFPMANPLQTPMQSFFNQQIPGAPSRPTHHAHQASIQLAAAGIHPPNLMTPVAGHFSRPSMILGPGGQPQALSHPFPNRNRRQLSVGGPPKAVLGGPARKVSPLPGPSGPSVAPTPPPPKVKKMTVNLPKETLPDEEGKPRTRQPWARTPVADFSAYADISLIPVDIDTAELYPSDFERHGIPDSIDVYLPGKIAWDAIKKKTIEEKLEKLGVERGSGSSVPHIHAPHARAASISSPADPALLLFKLNRLQQAQDANSANGSLSVSPQLPFAAPFGLSPSPGSRGPRFVTNRHGYSMSLIQAPNHQPYSSSPSPFNPFGYNAASGTESVADSQVSDTSADPIHMPQGRVPLSIPSFAPLSAVGGNKSHVDFIRGFGLDVPLESEEEAEEENQELADNKEVESEDENGGGILATELDRGEDSEMSEVDDATTTAPQTRQHSRHVSKLSAALSLRSVGGTFQAQVHAAEEEAQLQEEEDQAGIDADRSEDEQMQPRNRHLELDPVEEWTGSEDVYLGAETSDDESIGEWSNPSDEERARQQRVDRRNRRRAQQVDQPRRLPNFPRPPASGLGFLQRREDDIISNPSEENLPLGRRAEFLGVVTEEYYPEGDANALHEVSGLDIPPHSRGPSSQYSHSLHDPAMAHSRDTSENFAYPNATQHQSSSSLGKGDSLNPFAKPFVFGAARASTSGSWQPQYSEPSMPVPITNMSPSASGSVSGHSRLPSLGKPLNVAAPEFKPGNFNFRLPGAPQMPLLAPTFPEPERHEEPVTSVEPSPFKVQGREKRQRRLSSASIEEGDSMSSFKFPLKMDTSSPPIIRRHRSGSFSSSTHHEANGSAQPFTFAGFSTVANNMPLVPKASDGLEGDLEDSLDNSGTAKADDSEVHADGVVLPPPVKQKRAPIPLDFKHPVSSNTVPAGLFKALVGNEERTRRGVRSRLSSREIFEHSRRPSMDDDNVASIAHRNPRSRLVTDPGERPSHAVDDVFGSIRHARRRSSLPDALHDDEFESPAESPAAPVNLSTRMSLQHIEAVVADLLDEKLGELRQDLARKEGKVEAGVSSATESMMADVISLFRSQLHESAMHSLDDSQMDARGGLDLQMIKEVMVEGHSELLAAFEREIYRVAQHIPVKHTTDGPEKVVPVIEQVGNRTINAVVEAISELSARQEAFNLNTSAHEHDLIVDKIVNVLSPMLHSLHTDPIDYDFLTSQLTQAVKPHISQLIDLASDKRETAGLIVEKILPHLPSAKSMALDTDTITLKLIAEVRRAIAPIDAFEIKEQVADLVVERLDSRLAVRDKAFNIDSVTLRVTESISQLLETLNAVPAALAKLVTVQEGTGQKQDNFAESQNQIILSIANLPNQIASQLDEVKTLQSDAFKRLEDHVPVADPDPDILIIKNDVAVLTSKQENLAEQSRGALLQSQVILDKLNALPTEFSGLVGGLQSSLTELIATRNSSERELEDLRKINTEQQIQLAKARGNHGQARVEKDVLAEKLAIIEADRDRLRIQTKELQAAASTQASSAATLEVRNAELEEALAKALARLQSADVATQTSHRNIADLEKSKEDLSTEKHNLESKINSLEQELGFVMREKNSVSISLEALQTKHDALVFREDNWQDLNAATEKINMVFHLLENADSEEQKELRQYRDQSKILEDEKTTLQRRNKDLETKLANSEKSAAASRQTLSQAQQRSAEWERRAKDYEGQLEMVRTKFEQAEQTQSQLDQDYSLVKMQLEEHEADSRLQQDRENKLTEQIVALESKCLHLQNELEKANAAKLSSTASSAVPFRPRTNGNTVAHTSSHPDSRTSTIYDARGSASNRRVSYASSRSVLSPTQSVSEAPSVWDSMHAPATSNTQWSSPSIHDLSSRYSSFTPATPKAQPGSLHVQYPRGPSPTPSTISAAPTQGEDGWWS